MSLEKQINEHPPMPNYELRLSDLRPKSGLQEYTDRNFSDEMMGSNKSVFSTLTLIACNSLYISVPMLITLDYLKQNYPL